MVLKKGIVMNKDITQFCLEEYKTQASLLLKSLKKGDADALKHFKSLAEFFDKEAMSIINQAKRKHALIIVAKLHGFSSWNQFKKMHEGLISESFVDIYQGGFLNNWFASYQEAKAHQNNFQGFLLPYKKQFFICDADFINFIGFDADNPDWSLIAYDWIKPANTKSWSRLNKQLKQLKRARLNS